MRRKTRALETELLADEKELAEHNMLVDLGRNDLGRISQIGSVQSLKITCPIERYSHVMHIGSTVRGHDPPGQGRCGRCGCHPPGRHPLRCAEDPGLPDHRGTGGTANGAFTAEPSDIWISPAIWTPVSPSVSPIRKTAGCVVQSGAGIVADSVPENEYHRVLQQGPGCGSCTSDSRRRHFNDLTDR